MWSRLSGLEALPRFLYEAQQSRTPIPLIIEKATGKQGAAKRGGLPSAPEVAQMLEEIAAQTAQASVPQAHYEPQPQQ